MYAVIAEPVRDIHNWVSKSDIKSIKLLSSRLSKTNHGRELGPHLWKNYAFASNVRSSSLRCNRCLRLKAPFVIGPSKKSLRLTAFKSNGQNDDSGVKPSASKSLKKSVGLPYAPPESESKSMESLKAHSIPAYPSDPEFTADSLAIMNLFKSWLTLLRTPSAKQDADETLEVTSIAASGTRHLAKRNEMARIMKATWRYFIELNATVKIPMLIFIPSYIAVNIIHGSEVVKELYPLWIIGPLIVALYVKLLQRIWALYVFSFKQSVKLLLNIPNFFQVSYDYVFRGQLKEHVGRLVVQPFVDIKNMDFKEVLVRMVQRFNSWVVEKYLDYVESIWPYYCRTIRFLKRAHLL